MPKFFLIYRQKITVCVKHAITIVSSVIHVSILIKFPCFHVLAWISKHSGKKLYHTVIINTDKSYTKLCVLNKFIQYLLILNVYVPLK